MIDWKPAQPTIRGGEPAEVCVNLWWVLDSQAGLVYRVAGRAYALSGTEEEKLGLLYLLSGTDFHLARMFEIPPRFKTVTPQGTLSGVITPALLQTQHSEIFSHVFDGLEEDLPVQMRSVDGRPENYKMKIPQVPLCVTTCVAEDESGNLTPRLSSPGPRN